MTARESAAGDSGPRSYALPGHGAIELDVPIGWRDSVKQPPGALPPTIQFQPPSGDDFAVLLTPMWDQHPAPEPWSLDRVHKLVETAGNMSLKNAVEKEIAIVPIEGPALHGFQFSLTDRTIKEGPPEAGEWRCMTQGSGLLADLIVTFTVLTHSPDAPARAQALEMIRTARRATTASGAAPAPQVSLRKLTYPGKSWSLILDLPGFEFEERESNPDGTGLRVLGSNRATGLIISVFLEKAAKEGDAVACRDHYWKRARKSPLPMKDARMSERGDIALVEYMIPEVGGIKANQKNVNAYLSHDGIWIDIHLSKAGFVQDDWPLFESILSSIKTVESMRPAS